MGRRLLRQQGQHIGQRHRHRQQPAPLAGDLAQRGERGVELGLGIRPAALHRERGRADGLRQRTPARGRRRGRHGRARRREMAVRRAHRVQQVAFRGRVDGGRQQVAERCHPIGAATLGAVGQQSVEGQRPAQPVRVRCRLVLHQGGRALAHEPGSQVHARLQRGAEAIQRAGEQVALHARVQAIEQRLVDAVGDGRVEQRGDVVQPGRQAIEQLRQVDRAGAAQRVQPDAGDGRGQRREAAVALAAQARRGIDVGVGQRVLQRRARHAAQQRRIHQGVDVHRQGPEAGTPLVLVGQAFGLQPPECVPHQLLRRRDAAGRARGGRGEQVAHPRARTRQRAQRERGEHVTRGRVERRQGIVGNRRGHRSCSVAGRCAAAARQWTDPGSDDRVLNGISGPRA